MAERPKDASVAEVRHLAGEVLTAHASVVQEADARVLSAEQWVARSKASYDSSVFPSQRARENLGQAEATLRLRQDQRADLDRAPAYLLAVAVRGLLDGDGRAGCESRG